MTNNLSSLEPRVGQWLADRSDDMIDLLETLVNIDSGSYDKAGVDAVGLELSKFLKSYGIETETIPLENHGDAIRASSGQSSSNRPILLMGHRDTVFPKGEVSERPFKIEDGIAYGPGVADMKAGLVINSFVLVAMAELGEDAPLVACLYTGDEEIASPSSRPIIENEARNARVVFNSEPGRMNGNLVSSRKGGTFYRVEFTGIPAHSGSQYEKGRSAIEAMARKIQSWHGLSDIEAGITVNVGLVQGGKSINMVAPVASCEIDVRYPDMDTREHIQKRIKEIADKTDIEGTTTELQIMGEFNPLVESEGAKKLLETYSGVAREHGREVTAEFTGACADSGFAAAVGTPTLCATGPIGGNVHTPQEYLEVKSVLERAQLLAMTILRLPDDL